MVAGSTHGSNTQSQSPSRVVLQASKRNVRTHVSRAGGLVSTWLHLERHADGPLLLRFRRRGAYAHGLLDVVKPTHHPLPHPLAQAAQRQALHIFRRLHRSAHRRASTTPSVRSSSSSRRAPTASTTSSSSPSTPSRSCRLALHHRHPPASSRRCSTTP